MALYAVAAQVTDLPMKKAFKNRSLKAFVLSNGRNERIRTSDPFVPNEVRYQAALHSEIGVTAQLANFNPTMGNPDRAGQH